MAQPLNVKAQLVGCNGLDEVVVGAGLKGGDLVIDARSEGEHQQKRVSQRWRRVQLGENRPARSLLLIEVVEKDIWPPDFTRGDRGFP